MARRSLPWEYAIRNLGRVPSRTLLSVLGSALVVLLVVAATAFVRGMGESLGDDERASSAATGFGHNVILLGAGSEESVERSEIGAGVPGIAAASVPGVATSMGAPLVSPEIVFATQVGLPDAAATTLPTRVFATFRGVRDEGWLVHRQVRIVEGRAPGHDEVVVGRLAATRMNVPDDALAIGSTVTLDERPFTIVGAFEAPGTVFESELWCGLEDLRVATRRDMLSCVVLAMQSKDGVEDAEIFTKQRLDLELVAMGEAEYYAGVFAFYAPVRWMVWITAGLVGLGAVLGGLSTLYAAFAARVREFATLQTLGYSRLAVLRSLGQEALLSAAAGSLLAVVAALFLLDGRAVRISMGAFGLSVDEVVVATGLVTGLVVGVLGVLPPALRCLRIPVAQALRSG